MPYKQLAAFSAYYTCYPSCRNLSYVYSQGSAVKFIALNPIPISNIHWLVSICLHARWKYISVRFSPVQPVLHVIARPLIIHITIWKNLQPPPDERIYVKTRTRKTSSGNTGRHAGGAMDGPDLYYPQRCTVRQIHEQLVELSTYTKTQGKQ
ncbi:hypothetical protein BDV10DRAFT_158607 [Aspergillus recurvatus]